LFSRRFISTARRILPSFLLDRLDPFEAAIHAFVKDVALRLPGGARVLDAGAGEGRFKPIFANTRYIGVDFAQGDHGWDYSHLDAVACLEALPFADASFEHVISIVVLEHSAEPGRVLQEFRRVLGPGGTVHLVVPHMWEEHQRPHDYFRFTSHGIRYLMESAGFHVRRVDPVGGYFWMLSRRLMAVLSFTQAGWRWVFFPVLAPVFGLLIPLFCYSLDSLDRDRAYTLGFICEGSLE